MKVDDRKVDDDFHQLPTKCKNADGENYIKSFESGTNISIENLSQGYTHVSGLMFESDCLGICGQVCVEGGQGLLRGKGSRARRIRPEPISS